MKKYIVRSLSFGIAFFAASVTTLCQPNQEQPLLTSAEILKQSQLTDLWITQHATKLNDADLELLANTFYLSHNFATHDVATQKLTPLLMRQCWMIRTNTLTYTNDPELYKSCAQLVQAVATASQLRAQAQTCWKSCTEYMETVESAGLQEALTAFQLTMQQALQAFVTKNNDSFKAQLDATQQAMQQKSYIFNEIATLYKGLHEGECPIETTPENKNIGILDMAHQLAGATHEHGWDALEITHFFVAKPMELQEVSCLLMEIYYTKLMSFIKARKITPKMMFNETGVIKAKNRTAVLPAL